ncbi:ABC transporter permease [Candidatus Woesearchaeota archaeon]|nr:ABC transporter permease [Candidatus Woesearchaeota archaeon]MCF7900606.1 ABC transporter permease [Candidatus Woesearchaeota archaeon]MCF8013904.1 ABC transporter permease [Candidatus Woesearchaeota archaeon]
MKTKTSDWIPFYTLFKREFLRFFKVPNNTIFPQLITVLFYFLIFGIAIGSRIKEVSGVSYFLFILPGLFVQLLINGSYSNPSGSLYVARNFGNITDILLAPISYIQFTLAYIFAGMLRGFFLGLGTIIIAMLFINVSIHHFWILIIYCLLISFVFACFGILVGLWAETWEQLNIFINFVVTPLTFLGGVFYTLDMVSGTIATITQFNPIFYMINGVRYGMIGVQDGNIYLGLIFLVIIASILFMITYKLIQKGYHLRT